jgi:mannose-1-phosphate guanylyltransferase
MNYNNYCVIMAGGVGSRFWPFSKNSMPKQFLDFFGTGRTLLQMTFDRFAKVVPASNILIVSNKDYKDIILEQLPLIKPSQVLLEPNRRNTAPCVAYAVSHIKAINPKANMVVAPADHLILKEIEFLNAIERGLNFVNEHPNLLTLGIKPNRPETGYGYIQISDQAMGDFKKVKTFTEKPNLELAKVFVESGEFFWNSGVFIWSVESIWNAFNEFLPEIVAKFETGSDKFNTEFEQAFINEIFPSCPNISIDYGIMENAKNVYVLCGDFGWSDLGTWGSLYDMSEKDEHQNVTLKCKSQFYESNDNIVVLPENKLAVIQNLSGYIVVESDNVLLICKKEDEQRIRHFVTDVNLKYGEGYI